ncbi:MAG: hypothetical protein NTX79_04420 [Candidatus Micrarchaeota archaeon]|nr:hypothetical protein [Candidatus Micrarchaeota archaeon]
MRLAILTVAVVLFIAVFGCAGSQVPQQSPSVQNQQQANQTLNVPPVGAGAGEQTVLSYKEWKAPDGSITLLLQDGWTATEKQVDNCTVNWAVTDPAGTSSAYMNNEIMVLKSENARQMYKAYGLAGIDSVPVAGYLGTELAVQQIVAPLTGASGVKVTYKDAAASQQFSQAVCIPGLAACDAQVFEAAYMRNGILMRGEYFVQTYDFGDGTTWWINIWGYTSPASDWDKSSGTLGKMFASAKYTDVWSARCSPGAADASSVISEVIKSRQVSTDSAAEAWDNYIKGG